MSTEPRRHLVHDTKQGTDEAYDDAVRLLITREGLLTGGRGEPSLTHQPANQWRVDAMLATHNAESAKKALQLYQELIHPRKNVQPPGVGLQSLTFAQLKGMADELSFELTDKIEQLTLKAREAAANANSEEKDWYPEIGVFKYSVWGTFEECLLYMLRRAEENQDAAARSRGTARAMLKELVRRCVPFRSKHDYHLP